MIVFLLILMLALPLPSLAKESVVNKRIERLKSFITTEKGAFEQRKAEKNTILEFLDQVNSDQNEVRRRIQANEMNSKELAMALDNLRLEYQKHKLEAEAQKSRLVKLLKVAHRVKRDGVLRFILSGEGLSNFVARVRVLFRALRSHSIMAKEFEQKVERLERSEEQLRLAQKELEIIGENLSSQAKLLAELLDKKKTLLRKINRKQNFYLSAYKEVKQRERQLKRLFQKFDSQNKVVKATPVETTIGLPIERGKIVRRFGKQVHKRFKTISFYKGIEILADQNNPVLAVLPGTVEYDGWVKGLGNVVIIHHGKGLYSLSGHLYMSMKPVGTKVEKGETIGLVGDTGNSDRASLYFELRENDKAVDPLKHFEESKLKDLG